MIGQQKKDRGKFLIVKQVKATEMSLYIKEQKPKQQQKVMI